MTVAANRYKKRAPLPESRRCPACKDSFEPVTHNQTYCMPRCHQYGKAYDHDVDMPARVKLKWEIDYFAKPPSITDSEVRSLLRRQRAHEAKMRAAEALRNELAQWPAAKPFKTTQQNWRGCEHERMATD